MKMVPIDEQENKADLSRENNLFLKEEKMFRSVMDSLLSTPTSISAIFLRMDSTAAWKRRWMDDTFLESIP
jgi:hypothetical protein